MPVDLKVEIIATHVSMWKASDSLLVNVLSHLSNLVVPIFQVHSFYCDTPCHQHSTAYLELKAFVAFCDC